jgi:hypothetical protein
MAAKKIVVRIGQLVSIRNLDDGISEEFTGTISEIEIRNGVFRYTPEAGSRYEITLIEPAYKAKR